MLNNINASQNKRENDKTKRGNGNGINDARKEAKNYDELKNARCQWLKGCSG